MKTSGNSEQKQEAILPPKGADGRVRREIESILGQVEVVGQRWREIVDFAPELDPDVEAQILAGEIEPDFLHVARTNMECAERDHLGPMTDALRQALMYVPTPEGA